MSSGRKASVRKSKSVFVLLLLAAAIGGGVWLFLRSRAEEPIRFITAKSVRGDLRQTIIATGTIQPVSMVNVGTQISGTIKDLYIDFNSQVKKGQLIAVIDPATLEAQVEASRASLAALRADLLEAEASLRLAERDVVRYRELFKSDLIASADLDSSEASLETSRARVASAKSRVKQQEASLKQTALQLSYTQIYSPVDGVVVTKSVEEGQTVAASYNTPTIAEIAEDLSRMQVEVKVDEADIGGIFNGQRAEFNVDAYPEKHFTGVIEQIRLSPTTENNVTSYVAIVKFENDSQNPVNLIPGMTANVTLVVTEKDDVVLVPNAALRFRPVDLNASVTIPQGGGGMGRPRGTSNGTRSAAASKPAVYRLENGTPVMMEVERGITDGVNTEIISGLDANVDIITGIETPKDK